MAKKKSGGSASRFGNPRPFNKKNVGQLSDDKPVVYEGLSGAGGILYAGSAKKGRVQERLNEHLDSGDLPGVKEVRIKRMTSVSEARAEEKRIIKQEDPKLNKTD